MKKVDYDEILTKKETLEYLKIGRCTLEKLMNEKQISFIKLERKVFFKKVDIDEFIESRRTPAKSKHKNGN